MQALLSTTYPNLHSAHTADPEAVLQFMQSVMPQLAWQSPEAPAGLGLKVWLTPAHPQLVLLFTAVEPVGQEHCPLLREKVFAHWLHTLLPLQVRQLATEQLKQAFSSELRVKLFAQPKHTPVKLLHCPAAQLAGQFCTQRPSTSLKPALQLTQRPVLSQAVQLAIEQSRQVLESTSWKSAWQLAQTPSSEQVRQLVMLQGRQEVLLPETIRV
jgi:hypothetical protein